jgi:hypothetical protein
MPDRTPPNEHEREVKTCRYPSCEGETRAPVPRRSASTLSKNETKLLTWLEETTPLAHSGDTETNTGATSHPCYGWITRDRCGDLSGVRATQ